MNLIINEKGINIPIFEHKENISLTTHPGATSIKTSFTTPNPLKDIKPNTKEYEATLELESRANTKRISYEKLLTDKSGISIYLTLDNKDNSIESGYIDFYTIKQSRNKRNSFYRLEFIGGYFKLYTISRKSTNITQLTSYQISENLTPERLNTIIAQTINVISRHAKINNKSKVIGDSSSITTIMGLLMKEAELIETIEDLIFFDLVDTDTANELTAFLDKYLNRKNPARSRKQ